MLPYLAAELNYLRHLCTKMSMFFFLVVRKFSLKSKLYSFNLLDLLVGVYKTKSMQCGVSPNRVLIVNNNSLILNWFSKRPFE